jgi:hypothetical protein
LRASGNDSYFLLQFTHRPFSLCWSHLSLMLAYAPMPGHVSCSS